MCCVCAADCGATIRGALGAGWQLQLPDCGRWLGGAGIVNTNTWVHPPTQLCLCLFVLLLPQAARLGLNVGSIGHVGSDVYGRYMNRIMQEENIQSVIRIMPPEAHGTSLDETLLCFVLVDPQGK